jgi:hypothetical protein
MAAGGKRPDHTFVVPDVGRVSDGEKNAQLGRLMQGIRSPEGPAAG